MLGESTHELAGGRISLSVRAGSEWMMGKELVDREGMNDGREDVYLCRG